MGAVAHIKGGSPGCPVTFVEPSYEKFAYPIGVKAIKKALCCAEKE
jgi:hypothetical protein